MPLPSYDSGLELQAQLSLEMYIVLFHESPLVAVDEASDTESDSETSGSELTDGDKDDLRDIQH